MLKNVLLLLGIIFLVQTNGLAENVSQVSSYQLNPDQINRLQNLIHTNSDAKAAFGIIQSIADNALHSDPNPIQMIQTEGKLNSDPVKIATQKSLKDMPNVYSLSITYIVTHDAKYLVRAKEYLNAWAKTNKSKGDPIDDTNLEPMIKAYELIQDQFSNEERASIEKWFAGIVESEMRTHNTKGDTRFNNWNSHRLKIIGLIAFTLHNDKYIEYTIKGFKDQIEQDLCPDGQSFDFQHRDALHYHCYTLEPLLTLCIDAKLNGYDLYPYVSPSKCSLQKSVDFLLSFATGEKTHAEYVNSQERFDQERGNAGQADYKAGRLFEPHETLKTLNEYYFFNSSILSLIQKLEKNNSSYPSWDILIESIQLTK